MGDDLLINENFEILSALYDKQDSKGTSRTRQNEIGEELGKSSQTIIKVFRKLKKEGCLEKGSAREC